MRRCRLLLLALCAPAAATAQSELPRTHRPAPTVPAITPGDLMTRLYIFSDDSMLGREAGTPGNVKGTDYIAAEIKRAGLVPAGDDGIAADELNALFAPLTKFDAKNHLTYVQASSVIPNATATVWTILSLLRAARIPWRIRLNTAFAWPILITASLVSVTSKSRRHLPRTRRSAKEFRC